MPNRTPVLSRLIQRLARNESGNVAMIFSLVLVSLAVLAGGAADLNQAMNARTRLSQALDAAALAVGVQTSLSADNATTLASNFVAANYPAREIGRVQNLSVTLDNVNDRVRVNAEATVDTMFLGLIGIEELTVHWESEVQRARNALELVMVLDNTGSMGGSKIASLRNAGQLLTEILFESSDPDRLHIGLVPFSSTVNVGTAHAREWWLDPDGLNPLHSENFSPAANRWDLFDAIDNRNWSGCVEARAIPHDIEDTPPDPARPETLFLPYFAPDESDRGSYSNDYMDDRMGGYDERARMRNSAKYPGERASGAGPNWGCSARPLTPLTNHRATIDTAIDNMIASGTTKIPIGVSWGILVLSPQAPFTEGAAFDDDETIKAMVILTDGDNVMTGRSNQNYSDYSGYGYSRDGRLGLVSSSSSSLSDALDDRLAEACDYAKSLDIRVYTITFQVSSSSTRNLMRDCATTPYLYFDSPSDEALRAAFELIAGDLTNLRLSR